MIHWDNYELLLGQHLYVKNQITSKLYDYEENLCKKENAYLFSIYELLNLYDILYLKIISEITHDYDWKIAYIRNGLLYILQRMK